jgi:RNA polymerase sigma-70 factor (ECF subfamily)
MSALPPHFREILLMRDVGGMTLNEIADALEMSLPAVKSRLHRARVLVRERLDAPPVTQDAPGVRTTG